MAVGVMLGGADELRAALTSMSRVLAQSSQDEVAAFAEELKRESIKRAPRDTGDLERAHVSRVEISGTGRMAGVVEVMPLIGPSGYDHALLMHEGIYGKQYGLGPGSLAKNTGTAHAGVGVGWKFLERAFESLYRKSLRRLDKIQADVERVWR